MLYRYRVSSAWVSSVWSVEARRRRDAVTLLGLRQPASQPHGRRPAALYITGTAQRLSDGRRLCSSRDHVGARFATPGRDSCGCGGG